MKKVVAGLILDKKGSNCYLYSYSTLRINKNESESKQN